MGTGRVKGLKRSRPHPVRSDGVLEVAVSAEAGYTSFVIEFDPTQRTGEE
jgi:hypothetical protein